MTDTPKRGRGRPPGPGKLTPEVEATILQAVRLGMPFEAAAALGGVTGRTLRKWRAAGEDAPDGSLLADLTDKVEKAAAEGALRHLVRLDHAAAGKRRNANGEMETFEGDASISRWHIERLYGKPGSKSEVDLTSGGEAIPTTFVIGVSRVARIAQEGGGEDG